MQFSQFPTPMKITKFTSSQQPSTAASKTPGSSHMVSEEHLPPPAGWQDIAAILETHLVQLPATAQVWCSHPILVCTRIQQL